MWRFLLDPKKREVFFFCQIQLNCEIVFKNLVKNMGIDVARFLVNAMHSSRSFSTLGFFNIIDIHIYVICLKIRLNPKVGQSTRMH